MSDRMINRFDPLTGKWTQVTVEGNHEAGAPAKDTVLAPIRASDRQRGVELTKWEIPAYKGGSVRSVETLNALRFDPIVELVEHYRKLQVELLWHEQIRSGEIVPIMPSGKPRAYNAAAHMMVYDKLLEIGRELLRYGYGRVPEDVNLNVNRPSTMVINLTRKGEQFVLNDQGASDGDNPP
jgi:hypothetical protein